MSHAYLCGSALRLLWSCVTRSRNQFYVFAFLVVRDLRLRFELRNSQPQFVFRFCDFLARYFTKFSSLNTFSPEKRHISASSEGRIGPNSRVGAPPLSSRLRGPPRNRKSSGKVFLRCCYTMPKQATSCLIAPCNPH